MAEVKWSTEAKETVAEIASYLALHHGEEYADRVLSHIEWTIRGAAEHPTKGRPADALGKTRRWKINGHNYVVYQIIDGGIEIVDLLFYKRGD